MRRRTTALALPELEGTPHLRGLDQQVPLDNPSPGGVRPEPVRHPDPQVLGAVCRARGRPVLCLPDLLRRPVVSGRVLVLLALHPLHARRL